MLDVKINSKKTELFFQAMIDKTRSNIDLMRDVAAEMIASKDENFDAEGRPTLWKALKPKTIERRLKAGKWPGQILQVNRNLNNSILPKVDENRAIIGTNLPYARPHQFGSPRQKIPARPFLRLQEDEKQSIKKRITEWYAKP